MKIKPWDFLSGLLREGEGASGAGAGDNNSGGGAPAGGGLAARAAERAGKAGSGDGGQSGDGKPGGDPGGDPGAGGQPGAGAPAPYFPKDFPDQFKGTTNNETIDKLYAEVAGRPQPPEKPDGYTLAFSEDFKKTFGELKDEKDNKVLQAFRKVAHARKLDDATATGIIEDIYTTMHKEGLLDLGPDPDAEIEKLMPKTGDDASRLVAAQKRINDAGTWVAGLEKRGLDKAGVTMLGGLLENAQGIQTIEFLQRTFTVPGLTPGGSPGAAGGDNKDALTALMKDPRYETGSASYDKAFRADVDARWRRLHGAA